MKEALGKWLMDIAKYITTAVLLSTIFGEVNDKPTIVVLSSIAIITSLCTGLYLVNKKRKEIK
ncbi:DUF6722 family protein [Prevotella koreensis]|uniref:DUF6722 family protein n=1 Tax=Prevotella koreensis TaxID=2490854 RepID=UPI0028E70705|nr:DUF6722 family protein [Prevotella koreensis]